MQAGGRAFVAEREAADLCMRGKWDLVAGRETVGLCMRGRRDLVAGRGSGFMHAGSAGFGRREEDSRYAGEGGIWSRVEAVGLCMLRRRERG